jgi:hypothetical protein
MRSPTVAESWPQAFRVILKAEVIALGDNPRFVVTSLDLPTPACLYRDLYSARGQDENFIKMVKKRDVRLSGDQALKLQV